MLWGWRQNDDPPIGHCDKGDGEGTKEEEKGKRGRGETITKLRVDQPVQTGDVKVEQLNPSKKRRRRR